MTKCSELWAKVTLFTEERIRQINHEKRLQQKEENTNIESMDKDLDLRTKMKCKQNFEQHYKVIKHSKLQH